MWGSILVEEAIYNTLSVDTNIVACIGNSLWNLTAVPVEGTLPTLLYHREDSTYEGYLTRVAADDINGEELRYAVRLICEGASTVPIEEAAWAMLSGLSGLEIHATYRQRNYMLQFTAVGETLLGMYQEGPTFYRELGVVFDVSVTRGDTL